MRRRNHLPFDIKSGKFAVKYFKFTRLSLTQNKFSFIIVTMIKKKIKPHIGGLSLILIGVILLLIASDLVTKYLEEAYHWNQVIIPNFIEINCCKRNPGCAFSLLNDNPEIGQPILITVTFIMLAVVAFMFVVLPERFIVLKISASLIIAGAIGNLVDRLMFREVRDWFGLNMFGIMTSCNLADFFIVIGAILAVVDLLFLNEWAVFPITKRAKQIQAERKHAEESAEKLNTETQSSEGSDKTEAEAASQNIEEQTVTKEDNEN